MKGNNVFLLILVWIISAALIYIGMDISSGAYPLFGLIIPALVSLSVVNKGE